MNKSFLRSMKTMFIDRHAIISSKGILNPTEEEITDDDICVFARGTRNIIKELLFFKKQNRTR